MSADATAAAAASGTAAAASAFFGALFGVPLDVMACALVGSMLGLSLVKESPGSWRAAVQFFGYAVGAALYAVWQTKEPNARDGLAFLVALAGNPIARLVISRAEAAFGRLIDKIPGAKQ